MLGSLRVALLIPALASCAGETAARPAAIIPVEIRQAGDDGLTQRLVRALEQGIAADRRFALNNGTDGQAVTLIVPHVAWKARGATTMLYPEITAQRSRAGDEGAQTKSIRASCKEDEIELCARSILQRLHSAFADVE